jgi:uncharacterized protein (UPF0262 family)
MMMTRRRGLDFSGSESIEVSLSEEVETDIDSARVGTSFDDVKRCFDDVIEDSDEVK